MHFKMFEPSGLHGVSINAAAGTFHVPVPFCQFEMFDKKNVIFN
jgi:hypothetical protein